MNEDLSIDLPPSSINIIVSQHGGIPYLLLRKKICVTEKNILLVKSLINCGFHDHPIVLYPKFSDKIRAVSTLCEKGILYRDNEKKQYFYNI